MTGLRFSAERIVAQAPNVALETSGTELADINADGIADYRFTSDGSLIAAFRSYGENRFISTLAYPPNLGGYVDPVNTGS